MRRKTQGQVTAELAVLFAFVIAGFVFMGFYLQRAAQGSTKANTDSIGTQFSTGSPWNSQSTSASFERLDGTDTKTTSVSCSRASHGVGTGSVTAGITSDDCVPGSGAGFSGTSTASILKPTN